jgi:hypothetical protein
VIDWLADRVGELLTEQTGWHFVVQSPIQPVYVHLFYFPLLVYSCFLAVLFLIPFFPVLSSPPLLLLLPRCSVSSQFFPCFFLIVLSSLFFPLLPFSCFFLAVLSSQFLSLSSFLSSPSPACSSLFLSLSSYLLVLSSPPHPSSLSDLCVDGVMGVCVLKMCWCGVYTTILFRISICLFVNFPFLWIFCIS